MKYKVRHHPDGNVISDWDLDQEYNFYTNGFWDIQNEIITSNMLLVTRFRVGVLEDNIDLAIAFENGEYQDVNSDGTVNDWSDSLDAHMDYLMRILR
jgi:hypothetical protein